MLLARWYGPAGAIDAYGPALGLPTAVSTHMSYYLWGLPDSDWRAALAVGIPPEVLERYFADVELVVRAEFENVNPWERELSVYLCRDPKIDLRQTCPSLANYGH